MAKTLNGRTVSILEANGWLAGIVERQCGPIKRDLYGFVDVAACKTGDRLLVQVSSYHNRVARIEKLLSPEIAKRIVVCVTAAYTIELHFWRTGADAKGETIEAPEIYLVYVIDEGEGSLRIRRQRIEVVESSTSRKVAVVPVRFDLERENIQTSKIFVGDASVSAQ